MKRSLVAALVIGVLVSALVIAAHTARILVPVEAALTGLIESGHQTTQVTRAITLYALVVLIACGTAWLITSGARRKRLAGPLSVIALEILAVAWVCLLFNISFQPLPPLLAMGLAALGGAGYAAFRGRSRSSLARDYFSGRISEDQIGRISAGEIPFSPEPKSYETTAVVCDIANKHDLAEECAPEVLAQITQKFMQHATASFTQAGAYLDTITGEGVVAHFGFPEPDEKQAERATRHALALLNSFEKMREKDEIWSKFSVHIGISSGMTIIGPLGNDERPMLLSMGEPVELARRFCIANRFYGSSVLIGPRTFEMASPTVVSRPIDFLSGVDARERHEIYEPLLLAADATQDQIARRDSFWNGVVLYREKRWAEAYSQFQKARGPNDQEDQPLQLYLRRIEPLALHLVGSSDD